LKSVSVEHQVVGFPVTESKTRKRKVKKWPPLRRPFFGKAVKLDMIKNCDAVFD
jgi:hypothetical protein